MKNFKRVLAFVLILTMCLSLGITAYAAPGKGNSGRNQAGQNKAPVTVEFVIDPYEALVEVYAKDTGEEFLPNEDGTFSLAAGEYCYVVSAEEFYAAEGEFVVPQQKEAFVVEVALEAVPVEEPAEEPAEEGTIELSGEGVIEPEEEELTDVEPDYIYVGNFVRNDKKNATPVTTDPLNTNKKITPNGDGTYKVSLSVTGKVEQESHVEATSANVILIIDISSSMKEDVSSTSSQMRIDAVRDAAEILISAMPVEAKVDMAMMTFGGTVHTRQNWTTLDTEAKKTAMINNLPTVDDLETGTNWPDVLEDVKTVADARKTSGDTDDTYIIFLTDGGPSRPALNGHSHGSGGTKDINDSCITESLTNATAIVDAGYILYGIYANEVITSGNNRTTPYYRVGGRTYYTSYSDDLAYLIGESGAKGYYNASDADSLKSVFEALAKEITSNIGYNNVEIDDGVTDMSHMSVSVSAEGATGFEYFKNGAAWSDAPEATVENGTVKWNLGSAPLEDGVVYTVTFDVWPSQESYDLIADLNNAADPQAAYDALDDDVKAQIGGTASTGYYLKTNTSLTTSYTYNGNDYEYTATPTPNGTMALVAEPISLMKVWPENMLDDYGEAVYRDEEGNELTASSITLTLNKDGVKYLDVTVDKDHSWTKDDIFISCGVIASGVVKEPGHDYEVVEPAEFSYYWDLIAYIYHPMVINGVPTVLVRDDKATGTEGTDYYTLKGSDGSNHKYVLGPNGSDTLSASNYRRSNLNLTKVIDDACDVADTSYFTYKVKVTDANSTDGRVWFSAYSGGMVMEDWVISGAEKEIKNDNPTGYWYATNGAEITFKIQAGWNVRFLNLYHDSTFSFEETEMGEGFTLNKVEGSAKHAFVDKTITKWYDVEGAVITGTIVEPNNSYTVTYTNDYTTFFYVYHSSDNTIEKIANTDTRVSKDMTFDIVAETKTGTLYGGYYKDYSKAGMEDAEIIAAKYSDDGWFTDSAGTAYDATKANIWKSADAYTDLGTKMPVKANTVYYLKEVPNGYIRPYVHYTYDDVAEGKPLKKLYIITATDDTNYKSVGYIVDPDKTDAKTKSLVITIKKPSGEIDATLTAKSVFKEKYSVTRGYLYWDDSTSVLLGKASFTYQPCWTTLDGVLVKGVMVRTLTGMNGGANDIAASDVADS